MRESDVRNGWMEEMRGEESVSGFCPLRASRSASCCRRGVWVGGLSGRQQSHMKCGRMDVPFKEACRGLFPFLFTLTKPAVMLTGRTEELPMHKASSAELRTCF